MTYALDHQQREQMQELTSSQVDQLKERSKRDLFFLANGVLGYDQVTYSTHAALCNFIVSEPANRRMVLMPRGFLKSTIGTISDSIRLALCDANTRILIANETYEKAVAFLTEIKGHWTEDSLLGIFFPELLPERRSGPGADWSQDKASLKRSRQAKESTWNCIGVGGTAVSAHYERIKCDDLAGAGAKESEAAMKKAIRWTDDLTGLLDNLSDPIDFIGTRKTMNDVYAHLMAKWGDRLKIFVREPLENGETTFPKLSTESLLEIMNDTPETWAHDYMNNPIGRGGVDWSRSLIQWFTLGNQELKFMCPVERKLKTWRFSELDIVVTVDPNSGKALAPDKAAIIVHGTSPDDEIFVLEAWSGRPSPDGLIKETFDRCAKWRARIVGFEEAGQQTTLFYFLKYCDEKRQYFNVFPLKHKNKTKDVRIRTSLDVPLKGRRLFLQQHQVELAQQIQFHPQLAAHNWDQIDCLANGAQLYRTGIREEDNEAEEDAIRRIAAMRGVTGYGNSCYVEASA